MAPIPQVHHFGGVIPSKPFQTRFTKPVSLELPSAKMPLVAAANTEAGYNAIINRRSLEESQSRPTGPEDAPLSVSTPKAVMEYSPRRPEIGSLLKFFKQLIAYDLSQHDGGDVPAVVLSKAGYEANTEALIGRTFEDVSSVPEATSGVSGEILSLDDSRAMGEDLFDTCSAGASRLEFYARLQEILTLIELRNGGYEDGDEYGEESPVGLLEPEVPHWYPTSRVVIPEPYTPNDAEPWPAVSDIPTPTTLSGPSILPVSTHPSFGPSSEPPVTFHSGVVRRGLFEGSKDSGISIGFGEISACVVVIVLVMLAALRIGFLWGAGRCCGARKK